MSWYCPRAQRGSIVAVLALIVVAAMIATFVVLRVVHAPAGAGGGSIGAGGSGGSGSGSAAHVHVTVPPALPGEPALGQDREVMLGKFAANLSQGIYTRSNLLFLLCNSEAGRTVANQSGDPMTMALMRRMTALFRSAPGMASVTCPSPPPRSP